MTVHIHVNVHMYTYTHTYLVSLQYLFEHTTHVHVHTHIMVYTGTCTMLSTLDKQCTLHLLHMERTEPHTVGLPAPCNLPYILCYDVGSFGHTADTCNWSWLDISLMWAVSACTVWLLTGTKSTKAYWYIYKSHHTLCIEKVAGTCMYSVHVHVHVHAIVKCFLEHRTAL